MCDLTILLIIVVRYPLSDIEVARPKIGIFDAEYRMILSLFNHS
jgi:hypothetical protein